MNNCFRKFIASTTIFVSIVSFSTIFPYATAQVHIVSKGDTLWKIAQHYQMTLEELYQLNPQYLQNSTINVGEQIRISSITGQTSHTVVRGDTPWKISQSYQVDLSQLLSINGLKAGEDIFPGQILRIPHVNNVIGGSYTVVQNDTPWIISQKLNVSLKDFLSLNQLKEGDVIYVGQKLLIPSGGNNDNSVPRNTVPEKNSKTYITHTVKGGDNTWNIAIQYGIPFHELLQLNGMNENHVLMIGDKITIPVYSIAIKPTPGPQYGELLDWWTEAQYVLPIGSIFDVVDFQTGKRWKMKRTIGANHADCEPLTARDAAIIKDVWGGSYSWSTRPIIIEIDNRRLAASASSMPHDIQHIRDNSFNGHMDIYFSNSTRHVDGKSDARHQRSVEIAAGAIK